MLKTLWMSNADATFRVSILLTGLFKKCEQRVTHPQWITFPTKPTKHIHDLWRQMIPTKKTKTKAADEITATKSTDNSGARSPGSGGPTTDLFAAD